ncbi:MAG TPA: FeoA family protein [Anaerolineales bacterium]|jgi:ferrous iron transport protein A|nr:FeoA family protein [Anaerolineales bacterium]
MSIGSDIVLTQAVIGQPLLLVKIDGGKDVTRRLIELGLTPGVKLRLIQDSGGPVILAVRDSRIALGRGMANKIIVSPEETLS